MEWTEIKIQVPSKLTEFAENIANMVVPYGIYVEDYSNLEEEVLEVANINLIDEELLKMDRSHSVIHVYISPQNNPFKAISFLEERYNAENIECKIVTSSCNQEDWINNWKKYFKSIPIGNKLIIRPIWEDKIDSKDRKVLNLEPGLAFGTGMHETTRLCLKMLEDIVTPQKTILDVGCGSGILAIASLLLGAKSAIGIDIDELSVKTAIENAKINNVSDKFEAICGNLTDDINGKYDIIVVNIVADILIQLSANIKQFMKQNSIYIMSGIIDSRVQDVKNAIANDFIILQECEENGWVALKVKFKL